MNAFVFEPGMHLSAYEGDRIDIRSETGGLLLTCSKPEWLDSVRMCVRYELPRRIVVPVGISIVIEFDRIVDVYWNIGGVSDSQRGRMFTLPSFGRVGVGVFAVDGVEREITVAQFSDVNSDQVYDLTAPFRFDGSRCSSARNISFGYRTKSEGHFFYGVGDAGALTINGIANVPMLLNFGDSHILSVDATETKEDIVISSSPRMDSASVVSRLNPGSFSIDQALLGSRRFWYGREGLPFSGGLVKIRSSASFGEGWASCLGVPPPAVVSFKVPSAGDYCVANLASMHSWCFATLEVKRRILVDGNANRPVLSGLASFNGSKWMPQTEQSRSGLSLAMQQAAQDGGLLCIIEPGIMDGSFRANNQLVSFCRDFCHRFSRAGLRSFACAMSDGLSSENVDALQGSIDMASANTRPGTSVAVFVSPHAGDDEMRALRTASSSSHRDVYALGMHADSVELIEKYGINALVPEELAPMLSVQSGRQISVFKSDAVVRTG